jgi:hypothetical protein
MEALWLAIESEPGTHEASRDAGVPDANAPRRSPIHKRFLSVGKAVRQESSGSFHSRQPLRRVRGRLLGGGRSCDAGLPISPGSSAAPSLRVGSAGATAESSSQAPGTGAAVQAWRSQPLRNTTREDSPERRMVLSRQARLPQGKKSRESANDPLRRPLDRGEVRDVTHGAWVSVSHRRLGSHFREVHHAAETRRRCF